MTIKTSDKKAMNLQLSYGKQKPDFLRDIKETADIIKI